MEDSRWSKLIIIGVVLAVLAGGYFFLTNKFIFNKSKNTATDKPSQTSQPQSTNGNVENSAVLSTETVDQANITSPQVVEPSQRSAYETLANRNQQRVATLPNTGFPIYLIGTASLSAIIIGFSLRKFPN